MAMAKKVEEKVEKQSRVELRKKLKKKSEKGLMYWITVIGFPIGVVGSMGTILALYPEWIPVIRSAISTAISVFVSFVSFVVNFKTFMVVSVSLILIKLFVSNQKKNRLD